MESNKTDHHVYRTRHWYLDLWAIDESHWHCCYWSGKHSWACCFGYFFKILAWSNIFCLIDGKFWTTKESSTCFCTNSLELVLTFVFNEQVLELFCVIILATYSCFFPFQLRIWWPLRSPNRLLSKHLKLFYVIVSVVDTPFQWWVTSGFYVFFYVLFDTKINFVQDKNVVQHQISILLFVGLACGFLMILFTKFFGLQALTGTRN